MSAYGARSAQSRYLNDSIATASPARLLIMLYDRLVLDLSRAEEAQRAGDRQDARPLLMNAQDIVWELMSSLDTDIWPQGRSLTALYAWLSTELVGASISGDAARTAACREIVEPLRDAWREAALQSVATAAVSSVG